jgi:hypothetical protein
VVQESTGGLLAVNGCGDEERACGDHSGPRRVAQVRFGVGGER